MNVKSYKYINTVAEYRSNYLSSCTLGMSNSFTTVGQIMRNVQSCRQNQEERKSRFILLPSSIIKFVYKIQPSKEIFMKIPGFYY